jgi:chaperonin GroEL
VSDKQINSIDDVEEVLMFAARNKRPILIIADVDVPVMNTLNVNKAKGVLQVNVVAPEGVGMNRFELLEDIAIMTGAVLISDETGNDFSAVDERFLGEVKKSVSTDRETVITLDSERTADAVKERADMVRALIKKNEDKYNNWHHKDRLSRLAGGVAAIYVGASTEVEMKEKKDRVDDAIHATRAALSEGIVPGGGIALLNVSNRVNRSKNGEAVLVAAEIMSRALKAPVTQILNNAGVDVTEFMGKVERSRKSGYGLDVKRMKYGNMIDMGIIDPLKVTKNAVMNSVSVAVTILTTNCVISNKRA